MPTTGTQCPISSWIDRLYDWTILGSDSRLSLITVVEHSVEIPDGGGWWGYQGVSASPYSLENF